jgi:hypothetical protein
VLLRGENTRGGGMNEGANTGRGGLGRVKLSFIQS